MLDQAILQQLQQHFSQLKQPVVLTLNLDQSNKASELKKMAEQLSDVCDLLSIEQLNLSEQRAPSLALSTVGATPRIRFNGVPSGHEFSSLILAILQVGGHTPNVEQAQLESIKSLASSDKPLRFVSYISLSCQTCPGVVQALNVLAQQNPNISHDMVDGSVFSEEVNQKNILAVPSVYLNDQLFSQGAIKLEGILDKLDNQSVAKRSADISARKPYDVVVVGGGPAGASAAIYSARKGLRTAVVAERFGGQVMDTMSIENFISVEQTEGPKLAASLEQHVLSYDVDILDQQRVTELVAQRSSATDYAQLTLESGANLSASAVILATGARWREMQVPGEQEYRGRGVAYCPHCDGPLFKGKDVAVIGGGNSGIEAAIDLAGIVKHVTVLEFADTLRADEVLIAKAQATDNIQIIRSAQTSEVLGDGNKVTGLTYVDRLTGSTKALSLAGIFVQIGLVPNSEFLSEEVSCNARGEIIVDGSGQTSIPGIFAAGDVTDSRYKQIIISMGSGATAALGAFDHRIRQAVPAEAAA